MFPLDEVNGAKHTAVSLAKVHDIQFGPSFCNCLSLGGTWRHVTLTSDAGIDAPRDNPPKASASKLWTPWISAASAAIKIWGEDGFRAINKSSHTALPTSGSFASVIKLCRLFLVTWWRSKPALCRKKGHYRIHHIVDELVDLCDHWPLSGGPCTANT